MCHRSVAYTINAGGVKVWQSASATSSSTLAGQFMETFQDEVDSMKVEKALHCALYGQDEHLNPQHCHNIICFSLSPYSCPEGIQLVTTLLKTLLSKVDERNTQTGFRRSLTDQVHICCFAISFFNRLPCAVRFWEPGASIQMKTNSTFNPWMEGIATF
jgi:hypothetical protein